MVLSETEAEGRPERTHRQIHPHNTPRSVCPGSDFDYGSSKVVVGLVDVVDRSGHLQILEPPCPPFCPCVPSSSLSPVISFFQPLAS